ncbi:MAG: uroporphyrinogen-III synthase [Balneolales bacterium]|nr:uroporphyrinogen-III synthase [Balneolales bacterium]
MYSFKEIILTGNLSYVKPLEEAVYKAGFIPVKIPVMRHKLLCKAADLSQALLENKIENVVLSSPANTDLFLNLIDDENEAILKNKVVIFTQDVRSFQKLNDRGYPVLQSPGNRSIDMVEFFLRLNRTGPVLTPCLDPENEEIPEFLAELKYESRYLRMMDTSPFEKEELAGIRKRFYGSEQGSAVLLHEPGTLTQFLIAFPDANYEQLLFIPMHKSTENRLAHLGLNNKTSQIDYHPDHPEELVKSLKNLREK